MTLPGSINPHHHTADLAALPARILILGTADWDQAIATNQHYMTAELSKQYEVEFVESLGLRRPTVSVRDVRRMYKRLVRGRNPNAAGRPLPANTTRISPLVFPRHSGVWLFVNRLLLAYAVRRWLKYPGPRVLWTYSPITYDLVHSSDLTVYHCVDLLGEFPGVQKDVVEKAERGLASTGCVIAIGSSAVVKQHLSEVGFAEPVHWANVVDLVTLNRGVELANERVPMRAVFAGNLTPKKVDFDLLSQLVAAGVDLHLAGPIAEGGGTAATQFHSLLDQGATYHGVLNLEQLGHLYATATVGVIPYLLNAYTNGVDPLKTFEYLAAGLAVVSTGIPAIRDQADQDIHVEVTTRAFVKTVNRLGALPKLSTVERRQARASEHGWASRGREARQVLAAHLGKLETFDDGRASA